jgi:hypothetical protein
MQSLILHVFLSLSPTSQINKTVVQHFFFVSYFLFYWKLQFQFSLSSKDKFWKNIHSSLNYHPINNVLSNYQKIVNVSKKKKTKMTLKVF